MCNNKGKMSWRSGDNIHIEGITWDQCGDPKYPAIPAIKFENVYHISIINCTFRQCKACRTVYLIPGDGKDISVYVVNSSFMFNKLENASACSNSHGTLTIRDYYFSPTKHPKIVISQSMFYSNGNPDESKKDEILVGKVLYCFFYYPLTLNILIEHSSFSSNEILGMFLHDNAGFGSNILFNNVTVFNNSKGGVKIVSGSSLFLNNQMMLNITSSHFIRNNNGTLMLVTNKDNIINLNKITFLRNKGAFDSQGVALYAVASGGTSMITVSQCNFDHNLATGGDSTVYINAERLEVSFRLDVIVIVHSSSFTNNKLGPALHISQLTLKFCNFTLFENNSAESGSAINADKNALITACDESLVQFVNNTASLRGGAIYNDLSNCFGNGILFSNLSNFSSFVFVNNTARISGNSLYFSITKSCNIERDTTKNDSLAYIPYKLKFIQSHNTIGHAIATSPLRVSLCSPHECSFKDESCVILEKKMLGQTVYFNATVCDYFDAVAETVEFQIECINCNSKYKLLNNELLANSRSPDKIVILSSNDVTNDSDIILELSSVLSDSYKGFSARLSLTLSTCHNGFIFNTTLQKCDCYSSGSDNIVQCQEDHAEIKLGYWFGTVFKKRTTSLCPINYCNFNYRTKTRSDYYTLLEKTDDQCSLHRTGVACSYCKSGYTLVYDSFDCINDNHCSPGMTVLVIALTFLYWIIIVVVLLSMTHYFSSQVSSGYFNGVIYFYSIVDVVLVGNLYIMDGIFYTVVVLSSFAQLTPKFLGRLCIAQGLDAIDQQFIHYFHTLFISVILIGIVIIAKYFRRVSFYINRCIARVTFLFLTFSYTSVTSTSIQLLRGIQYNDIDGVFVYLSPQFKYFTHRHAVYATVALLCGLIIVIGLPILLIVEPFLKKKIIIMKLKPILNQFQDSYKDKYQWFAGYYLLCRLVIILIAYFGNSDYNNMVYYIQTACVIIIMNHAFFHPYKKHLVNVLDAAILLTMLLIVNLNNFNFTKSVTAGLVYTLLFIPLFLLFGTGFTSLKTKFSGTTNQDTISRCVALCIIMILSLARWRNEHIVL